LSGPVAGPAGGVAGEAVDRQGVGVVAALEVPVQGGRELDGVGGPAVGGGVRGDGGKARPFGV
jgi:hypothetical protein